ncbi:uncharacterized protein LOC125237994 [Leguminivora glycinivorella]|uniref:uncharacterized protein LOC125237994 n=1 Tax=Leguminivora glycinivorella TaxID=1035111 RepID=UPI00200EFF31|nr:uncharacterized protein LOC125237994 [Leguminivora glycinivorella]
MPGQVKPPLREVLEKITKEQEYDSYVVREKDGDGSNIMSSLSHVTLHAKGKTDMKLFAKSAAWSAKIRVTNPVNCPYSVELYFYETLWKQYEKLEDTFSVPKEHRFRKPKLFGCGYEYLNETLVLEDMVAEGYKEYDRQTSVDYEYMSTGIMLMAQFHALSLAYSKYNPEAFKRASEYLTMDESKLEKWIASVAPKMLSTAISCAEEHRDTLKNYFHPSKKFNRLFMDYFRKGNDNVLIHGDFKPSNILHRRRNGKLELVVVDFQLVHDANAVVDLMFFIFTATDESFRRAHFHELLHLYYEKLRASLLRLHIDPDQVYPEKTYRARLEEFSMLGLAIGVGLLPVVLMDKDKMPDFHENAGIDDFAVEGSPLFKERFNGILNNYVEWGLL